MSKQGLFLALCVALLFLTVGIVQGSAPASPPPQPSGSLAAPPVFIPLVQQAGSTRRPIQVSYCGSEADRIYRIEPSAFRGYLTDSASGSPLRHMTSPPAPTGWNQPDFVMDQSWRPAESVWFEDWSDPGWSMIPDFCSPIGLRDESDNPLRVGGLTYLSRRTFELIPPNPGMVITRVVLQMWSDNKTEWWWQGTSVAYDHETNVGEVELFPRYVQTEGGQYTLAIQNSNDLVNASNPHGTAYRLRVTWDWSFAPRPTPTPTPTRTPIPCNQIVLLQETFEGSFPGPWRVTDAQTGYGEYMWGKRGCRPYGGTYSGWAVGGGVDGAALPCGSSYPSMARSWMIYGPFSLADARAAELRFNTWFKTEQGVDELKWMASVDGTNFYGWRASGDSTGWVVASLDLANVYTLGNLLGRSQVYIGLFFGSNDSVSTPEGVYVDNITLTKCVPRVGAAAVDAVEIPGTAEEDTLPRQPAMMTLPHPLDSVGQ